MSKSFLKTMLLLCALIVGSLSSWAEDVTLTEGEKSSPCTVNEKEGIKVGTNNAGGDMTITVPANTTKLILHAAAWKGVTDLSLKLSGATASPDSISLTADDGISSNTPFTLSGDEKDYEFEISLSGVTTEADIKVSPSIAKRFVVWGVSAVISNGGSSPTVCDLALTGAPIALNFDLYNNRDAQVIHYTTSSTGAVTVGINSYVTFLVDEQNKTITVTPKTSVTPSPQTITVSQAADDNYTMGKATFKVDVTNSDPNALGAMNNPYDVAQAISYIKTLGSNTSPNDVYVSGIISQVDSFLSAYNSITYWISDDGTTTTQMEVYSGKGLEGADFSEVKDLAVGDIVTVKGKVKMYNTTPEFTVSSQLVNFERPVSIICATPTFTPEAGTYNSSQDVVITTTSEGATIYYTLDGTVPSKTNGIQYSAPITVSETMTIKAIAVKDGLNDSEVASAIYTINIPVISASDVNLSYDATLGSINYTVLNDVDGGQLTAVITAGNEDGWLTIDKTSASAIALLCTANEGEANRTATVTLTYTYDSDKTVTKVVAVTQAHFIANKVRQKPQPVTTAFAVDEEFYLYNIGAQAFFTEGNSWGTQASIGEQGLRVKFTESNGAYLLQDLSIVKNAWKLAFFDSDTKMFVDRNKQENYFWEIENNEDGTFRLLASSNNPSLTKDNYPDMYVGLDVNENVNNTALSPFLFPGKNHFIDWAMVSLDEYEVLSQKMAIYYKAQELKDAINKVKAQGGNTDNAEMVYLDETASIEQLDAAIEQLILDNITPSNPYDMTSKIVNSTYSSNNNTGWSGTVPAFQSYSNAEHYNKKYDTYQTVSNMPPGVYLLGLQAYYRAGYSTSNLESQALFYAQVGENRFTKNIMNIFEGAISESIGVGSESTADGLYVPNNMQAAAAYFEIGRYHNELLIGVEETSDITIGLFKDQLINGDWTCWDNWTLIYYGNGEAAIRKWGEKVAEAYPENYGEGLASTKVIDLYKSARQNILTAATFAEIKVAVAALPEAYSRVDANIAAWEALKSKQAKMAVLADNDDYAEENRISLKTLLVEVQGAIDAMELETEDIVALTERLNQSARDVMRKPVKDGADMTLFLSNPDFEESNEMEINTKGWTTEYTIDESHNYANVRTGGTSTNLCYESYQAKSFDVYQEVENMPLGVYEIEVQGFYRYKFGNDEGWRAYQAQEVDYVKDGGVPVYVYMNNNATPFGNIYDEPVEVGNLYQSSSYGSAYTDPNDQFWYPNEMYNSALAFEAGMYKQSAFGLVAKEGDALRLGVKGSTNQDNGSWAIWDNFKLRYRGFKPEVIKPVLEETMADVRKTYMSLLMGKTEYAALTSAMADAATAIENNDGEAMFKALNDLYNAKDPALASKDIFIANEIPSDTLRLAETIREMNERKLSKETLNNAKVLLESICKNKCYENDESELLKKDVSNMIQSLYESCELYSNLNYAIDELNRILNGIVDVPETVTEANTLLATCQEQYEEGTVADADVPGKIEALNNMKTPLLRSVLLAALAKAEMITDIGKTASSFSNLQNVIANIKGKDVESLGGSDIDYYSNQLQSAINNIELRTGYSYLTANMFKNWDNVVTPAALPSTDGLSEVTPVLYVKHNGSSYPIEATPDGDGMYTVIDLEGGENNYDTQFWIASPGKPLPEGEKYYVEFDFRADRAATSSTESHGAPGGYIHWQSIGSIDFTEEWQSFSQEVTINSDMANWQSIAFDLNVGSEANTYYFKNVVLKVPEDYCNQSSTTNCTYELQTPTQMVYGNSSILENYYADLSDYDKLYIPVVAGTPRVLMNRTEAEGQFNEDQELSKMIEMPKEGTWTDSYYTKSDDGKLFTYDIAKIVKENGFAHLNAIKGANWQDVTVSELVVFNSKQLIKQIDYSTVSTYPFYRMDPPEGASYDVINGTLTFENTLEKLNPWDIQAFIINGFSIKRGYDYIVRVTYKSTASGKINVQFGTWDLNMSVENVEVNATESYTTLDIPFSAVSCPTENNDAFVIWHGGSIVGIVNISKVEVFQIIPEDPLFDDKVDLRDAVAKAELKTDFGKTEASFANLTNAINNAKSVLETVENKTAIINALNALNTAVDNLTLLPGYIYLTTDMFHRWQTCDAPVSDKDYYYDADCHYMLCESSGNIYGNSDVNKFDFADLSKYDYLYIPVAAGTPRVLMNRTETDGQFNADKEQSKMIEIPMTGTWSDAYYTKSEDGKLFTYDIAKIVEDYGFAHLNAIKDVNWAKVTVTDLILYTESAVAEDEWNQMAAAYALMENTDAWKKQWSFTDENRNISNLPGVEMRHRHIVSINLNNNNLSGGFPFALLNLPYLETLNVSSNSLSGDIGLGIMAWNKQSPTTISKLKEVRISNNQFEGNLGLFANALPQLNTLYANNNRLTDIYPQINPSVTTLYYNSQQTGRVVPLHLGQMKVEEVLAQLPTILLYDHNSQIYREELSAYVTDEHNFGMTINYSNGKVTIKDNDKTLVYRGQSGDIFLAQTDESHTFNMKFSFDQGDSNFDGDINILDVQSDINFIFEEQYRPFNFTAANLWEDDILNVQDVVKEVNLLLEQEEYNNVPTASRNAEFANTEPADATIFCHDGQLVLNTNKTVAALDVTLFGTTSMNVSKTLKQMGFNCVTKRTVNGVRLVAYSMTGAILPIGETVIGTVNQGAGVSRAMLTDKQAAIVSVSLNPTVNGIYDPVINSVGGEVYRLPIGSKRAIVIDSKGNKTLQKNNSTMK